MNRYLEGGVASGLNAVDGVFKPKLFHVKGKRRPVTREVGTYAFYGVWVHIEPYSLRLSMLNLR